MIEQLALLFGRSHSVVRRSVIIFFYLVILASALYLPLLFDQFRSQKTLNVYAFTETFSPESLELFEKKTGIKVNMTYAELDEEIGAKFSINAGAGYDVVNASDFMVHFLANKGYLQPLNKDKIRGVDGLDVRLMGHTYDKLNRYSLPHKWFMYGLIYDKEFFKISPDEISLKLIFEDPVLLCKQGLVQNPYRICMLNSPLDAYFITMLYAFNRVDWFTPTELSHVADTLIKQKQWVECYSFNSVEYFLLSGIVPIAVTASNFMRKIWETSDRFDFAIPKEGGIIIIENLVIPAVSKKSELAHQFIEFMLSDEIATLNSETYGWTSSNCMAQKALDEEYAGKQSHLFPTKEVFQRLQIPLFNSYARKCADEAWLRVCCA
jgi:spermidine/putrescine-binding protein